MKLRLKYSVQRMDHDLFPYDLVAGKPKDYNRHFRVELKSLNWKQLSYPTAVIEVYKDNNKALRPQWYEYNDQIEIVALQNIADFKVHMFDASKLKQHFVHLESVGTHMFAAHASSNQRNNCPGFTYKIAWQDTTVGYTGTTIDITDAMLHYALANPHIQKAFPDIFQSLKSKYTRMLKAEFNDDAKIEHQRLIKLYSI